VRVAIAPAGRRSPEGKRLDPDQHDGFGQLFGKLESHPNLDLRSERPEFFQLHARGGVGGIADE
jgi:hypothetical protein